MRKVAIGYSTACNIRCKHCVAAGQNFKPSKMELSDALFLLDRLAAANVGGISFTAGEPFVLYDDLCKLITRCSENKIFSRVVTNGYWAESREGAREKVSHLKNIGLSQLRLSFSRWHRENINEENILHCKQACERAGLSYFVSFVTDFDKRDKQLESFLRQNEIKYFPEPLLYSGSAESFSKKNINNDFNPLTCLMNPYIGPDFSMYGCCDAGAHFSGTDFFLLGNLKTSTAEQLFASFENNPLYNYIRNSGLAVLATSVGMMSGDIITYRKCDLCRELFDSKKNLHFLEEEAKSKYPRWVR